MDTTRLIRHFVLLAVAFRLLAGCYAYNTGDVTPRLDVSGSGAIVAITHDQRPYVVSGGTDPNLIGLLRAPMGIPYPVRTQSRRPLADEISEMICTALTEKGFQCTPMELAPNAAPDALSKKLNQDHANTPALLLILHEWKSDTHTDTAVAYDMTLRVLDSVGVQVAETHIKGRDVLGGTFWNSARFARKAVPQALQRNLETLLGDPAITKALEGLK
jgi:hypothetical protein